VIGLDTNVLVRYAIRDDATQARMADRLIEACTADDPGHVSHVALVELWWVLTSAYGQDRLRVAAFIDRLLTTATIAVQSPDLVHAALRAVNADGADFADAMIAVTDAADGCDRTMTFDRKAARRAGMTLLT
jgi:predicted nucleic-acid-binding protein